MDQAQTRMMGILAALLGVVTAALYWFDAPGIEAYPEATVAVWSVAPDAVARIEIARADGRLVFARGDAVWQVLEPDLFDADPERVRALLDSLTAIEQGVPIQAADPPEFGLGEPPVAAVTIVPTSGEPQSLTFGHAAPVGWSTYARTASGVVVAVPGKLGEALTASADHFRDRRILRFDPGDVRGVTLTSPNGVVAVHGLERAGNPATGAPLAWWLDGFTRADPDAVDDLVTGLLMLRFEEIVSEAPPSIVSPLATVRVETTQRDWVLRIGASDGAFSPAEVDGGASGTVLSEALAILGMGPTDLGDSRAFPYDPDSTDRLEVVAGERRWVAVRNGSAWEVDGKVSPAADDVASAVDGAAIAYTRDPVPPSESIAMSVFVGEGTLQRRVDVGAPSGELATLRDADGGAPYRVAEEDLAPLRRVFTP